MLVNAANDLKTAGYDPAVLPDSSKSWSKWGFKITLELKDGTFEGLSGITRNGDTNGNSSDCVTWLISGNLRMSQSKGFLKASVLSLSADIEATVDHVDMLYEIEARQGQIMNLTRFEITDVGTIDVEISGIGTYLSKIITLTTNLISDYIAGIFEDEVQVAMQNYLTNMGNMGNIVAGCTTKILVVTGSSLTTEIIDFADSSFGCTQVGNFPTSLYFATGGLVDDVPTVCGGKDTTNTFHTACYTLQENGAWTEDETATLIRGKQNAISGSVVLGNKLYVPEFVTENDNDYLNFEMVAPNTASETLQPMNDWGHFENYDEACIVRWDDNTIMLIGVNTWRPEETFFIHMGNQTVTQGPTLMEKRIFHACHEITVQGEEFIIVTGGWGESEVLKSTEILAKSSFGNGWQQGNNVIDFFGEKLVKLLWFWTF